MLNVERRLRKLEGKARHPFDGDRDGPKVLLSVLVPEGEPFDPTPWMVDTWTMVRQVPLGADADWRESDWRPVWDRRGMA